MDKLAKLGEAFIIIKELVDMVSGVFSDSMSSDFYKMLNELAFLTADFLEINSNGFLGRGKDIYNSIINLSNVVLCGCLLFYCFRSLFGYFLSKNVEIPWKVFIRGVICAVFINSSFFVCYTGVFFMENMTKYFRDYVGEDIINFNNIENYAPDVSSGEEDELNIFETNNLIGTFMYFSTFFMAITLGIRFILIKGLIFLAPIFFSFGLFRGSEKVLFLWAKLLLVLMFSQILYCVLIAVVETGNFDYTLISQTLVCAMQVIIIKSVLTSFRLIKK